MKIKLNSECFIVRKGGVQLVVACVPADTIHTISHRKARLIVYTRWRSIYTVFVLHRAVCTHVTFAMLHDLDNVNY